MPHHLSQLAGLESFRGLVVWPARFGAETHVGNWELAIWENIKEQAWKLHVQNQHNPQCPQWPFWGFMFGLVLLFLIWHAWPKSKKIALPRWNLWPLCASGSLCCIFRPAGVHVEEATPWIPVPDSCTRWACSVLEFALGEDLNYLLFDFLALAAWYKKYILFFPNSTSMLKPNYFLPKSIFKKKKITYFFQTHANPRAGLPLTRHHNWVFIVCLEPSTIFYNLPRGLGFPVIPATLQRQTSSQKQARTGERCFSPHHCVVFLAAPPPSPPPSRLHNIVTHSSSTHNLFRHLALDPTSLFCPALRVVPGSGWVTRRKALPMDLRGACKMFWASTDWFARRK